MHDGALRLDKFSCSLPPSKDLEYSNYILCRGAWSGHKKPRRKTSRRGFQINLDLRADLCFGYLLINIFL